MKRASLTPILPAHDRRHAAPQRDGNAAIESRPVIDAVVDMILAERHLQPYRAALRAARPALSARAETRALLAERLKAEADRHWTIDPHISLRLAHAIIVLGRLGGEQQIVAMGTMARADALSMLGEPRFALTLLTRAATLFRACGDEVGWARTRISAMGAFLRLGQLHDALAVAPAARTILAAHGDVLRVARLDSNTAFVHELLGQHEDALRLWDAVIAVCTDPEMVGGTDLCEKIRLNRAMTLHRLGRLDAALDDLRQARAHFSATGQSVAIANVDWIVGVIWFFQGRYGPALRAFEDARAAFETLGLSAEAAGVGCDILECLLASGRADRVRELADDVTATLDQRGFVTAWLWACLHRARALQVLDQREAALEVLNIVRARLDDLDLPVWQARCAIARVQVLLTMASSEAIAEARGALATALAVYHAGDLPVEMAQALLLEARLLAAAGQMADAHQAATHALTAAMRTSLPGLIVSSRSFLADLDVAAGRLTSAAAGYAEAVAMLEQMQQHMTLDMRRNFLSADPSAIFASAIRLAAKCDLPGEVFDLIEQAKARALLDHIERNIDLRPRDDDDTSREIIADLRATRDRYRVYLAALGGRESDVAASLLPVASTEDALIEARRCEARMRTLVERLHLRNPAYGEAAILGGARSMAARPVLGAGSLLLDYYVLEDDLLIATLADDDIGIVRLPGAWPAVRANVSLLHLNMQSTAALLDDPEAWASMQRLERQARGILRRLWDRLIAPVADRVGHASRLIIAPCDTLHYVPFHALHDGERYLVEHLPTSTVPSAGVLAALRQRVDRLGAGRTNTPPSAWLNLLLGTTMHARLPYVAEELQAVARHIGGRVLLDGAATSEALAAAAEHASVLHLATHGSRHPQDPLFSFVQLADGPLTTADILDLRLRGALVTLSACETGLGNLGGGDDLDGVSRSFFYAGASALLVSLWRVADRSTARLMDALYAALAAGSGKDDALRQAQLSLLRQPAVDGAPPTSHPYFWSPFVLVGDSRPLACARSE